MAARYNYCFTYNNYTPSGEEELKRWITENCKYGVFGHEVAPTTGTPHLQGYFSLQKKSKTDTIQNKLKKLGIKLKLIYAEGNAKENRVYCSKDGNFWEHGEINICGHSEKKTSADDVFTEAFAAPTVEEGLKIILTKRPRDYALYSDQIERSLRRTKPEIFKHSFDIGTFKAPPIEFNNKAVLLWGATNTGKTQFALANFKNPLLVRHLDKLSELNKDHDGIVFDDVDLKNRPPHTIIHLLDWDCESSVHIRYKVATIPARTKKVFTSNIENPFYELGINTEIMAAIERRLVKFEINTPLY